MNFLYCGGPTLCTDIYKAGRPTAVGFLYFAFKRVASQITQNPSVRLFSQSRACSTCIGAYTAAPCLKSLLAPLTALQSPLYQTPCDNPYAPNDIRRLRHAPVRRWHHLHSSGYFSPPGCISCVVQKTDGAQTKRTKQSFISVRRQLSAKNMVETSYEQTDVDFSCEFVVRYSPVQDLFTIW